MSEIAVVRQCDCGAQHMLTRLFTAEPLYEKNERTRRVISIGDDNMLRSYCACSRLLAVCHVAARKEISAEES